MVEQGRSVGATIVDRTYVRGFDLGPVRRRGWVRPGLTVHLAKYDRTAAIGDVGCYHVFRTDGFTLCGRDTRRPNWRDAGWGDSEVLCCKLCARIVWSRWLREGGCDGVDLGVPHTVWESDNWPARLDADGQQAPLSVLAGQQVIKSAPRTPGSRGAEDSTDCLPASIDRRIDE